MLTTVEKVIFLQDIDIFENTSTADLAHIAAITEEIELGSDDIIYKEGDIPDSMYLVVEGGVQLQKAGEDIMVIGPNDAFGTWALFDDIARMVTAIVMEDSCLLRIDKEEFLDLLADHVQITRSLLGTLAKRLRSLIERTGIDSAQKK